mmetsp:Transcript_6510/g.11476  ORF Transcript_6510/g.11476 Transcript_6510/m.11476 type:complete len:103 (-) Transcript_6510:213-521(-)
MLLHGPEVPRYCSLTVFSLFFYIIYIYIGFWFYFWRAKLSSLLLYMVVVQKAAAVLKIKSWTSFPFYRRWRIIVIVDGQEHEHDAVIAMFPSRPSLVHSLAG